MGQVAMLLERKRADIAKAEEVGAVGKIRSFTREVMKFQFGWERNESHCFG